MTQPLSGWAHGGPGQGSTCLTEWQKQQWEGVREVKEKELTDCGKDSASAWLTWDELRLQAQAPPLLIWPSGPVPDPTPPPTCT